MKKVFISSPYRGDVANNVRFAASIAKKAALGGAVPVVPHLYFPSFLDDDIEVERKTAIRCGLELLSSCDEMWVCGDVISEGMALEIDYAYANGITMKHFNGKGEII